MLPFLKKFAYFVKKTNKYLKGRNTREALVQSVELRSDKTVREIAIERCDERIIAITSRDIVAAEEHYHKTCYRQYTKKTKFTETSEDLKQLDDNQEAEKISNPTVLQPSSRNICI